MVTNMPRDKLCVSLHKVSKPFTQFALPRHKNLVYFCKIFASFSKFSVCLQLSGLLSILGELHAAWHSVFTHTQNLQATQPKLPPGLCKRSLFTSDLFHIIIFLWLVFQADLHTCIFPLFSGVLNHILIHLYSSFIIAAVQQVYLAYK